MGPVSVHDAVQHSLAAYLFGALERDERTAVSSHLLECAPCREELASLAGLPGLLARVDPADIEPTLPGDSAETDARLLQRSLAELARRRRRAHRRRRTLAVAAGVAVLATAGVLAQRNVGSSSARPAASDRSFTATDGATGVRARFDLSTQPWGTQISVELKGAPQGTHCVLLAVSRSGARAQVGTWQSLYERTTTVTTASDVSQGQLAALEVDTADGHRLVAVDVT